MLNGMHLGLGNVQALMWFLYSLDLAWEPIHHASCLSLKLEVVRDTACCLKSETFPGIDSGSSFIKESQ